MTPEIPSQLESSEVNSDLARDLAALQERYGVKLNLEKKDGPTVPN